MTKKYYYKAMSGVMGYSDFEFEVGKTYTIDSEELKMSTDTVFHFCESLEDTIDYYWNPTDRHFLIEVLGDIVTERNQSCSNKIRIIREISREEIEEHIQDKDSKNSKLFLALYTTNIEILETLYKDEYWKIRRNVAENPNTPAHLLEALSKDLECNVRCEVAENSNTTTHILEKLAKDKDWRVRRAVARKINTLIYILEELEKDKDEDVRKTAKKYKNNF